MPRAIKVRAAEALRYAFRANDSMRLESVGRHRASLESVGDVLVNDQPICSQSFRLIDPMYADLLDIAVCAYLADRFSPRRALGDREGTTWGRVFSLQVPVRCPDVWASETVVDALRAALHEFTEDEWEFRFVLKKENFRESEKQLLLSDLFGAEPWRVSLFSGGLDSFAGTAQTLSEFPQGKFVLVSGATHGRQATDQRALVGQLQVEFPATIRHLSVTYGIRRSRRRLPEEKSQRSRGFLYLTLGTVTSLMTRADDLHVFENGIGAVNLRYNSTQLGTASTRAMNPVALRKMERLIRVLTGRPFRIVNRFLFATKGEMCAHPSFTKVANMASRTFSCDGYPHRIKGVTQCGVCTSCLLRRLSFQAAGLSAIDPGEFYNSDLGRSGIALAPERLHALRVMDRQAHGFAELLRATNPGVAFFAHYPELGEVAEVVSAETGAPVEEVTRQFLSLYQRYVNEWNSFSFPKILELAPMVAPNAASVLS